MAATVPADAVQVVENYCYQNAVRILLQMDAGASCIREYVTALELLLLPPRPKPVYFEQLNVAEALRATTAQHGPAWTTYSVDEACKG